MFNTIVAFAAIASALIMRTTYSAHKFRALELMLIALACLWPIRVVGFALAVVVLAGIAYSAITNLGIAVYRIVRHQMVPTDGPIWAHLRAEFFALLEEIVSYRQRPADVFPMCGSYPTAPGIITVMMFGGATVSAVTTPSDYESVRRDLILQYQCVREAQIASYFARIKREAAERLVESKKKEEQERKQRKIAFEQHAIAQRNYANPHMAHCPLTRELHATCRCHVAAPSQLKESCRTYAEPRKPSPFEYGQGDKSNGYRAGCRRNAAERRQTRPPIAAVAAKQPWSAVESEAALAKLRAGLGIPDPRTSPQVLNQSDVCYWTIWHYPEVREAYRQWQANQAMPPPVQQGYAAGYPQNPPAAPPAASPVVAAPPATASFVSAPPTASPFAAASTTAAPPPAVAMPPQGTSSSSSSAAAAPTQPIRNAQAPPPNGVTPFIMTSGNSVSSSMPAQASGPPAATVTGFNSTIATTNAPGPANPQGPAPTITAPTLAPNSNGLLFPSVGPGCGSLEHNPIINTQGKMPKDKMVKRLMQQLLWPLSSFDRNKPNDSTAPLTLAQSLDGLLSHITALHQYVALDGVWQTNKIGYQLAAAVGFKGLEWEHVKTELGAYAQMGVQSPDQPKVLAALDAFNKLDQLIPAGVVG